jgi:DNA primase
MSLVDEIKGRLEIVDVVGQYVTNLQKSGRNYKAPCPFHTEKTPSFFVFPDRQSWRCFGACATGGDAFTFVMKREQLSFSDALKILASHAGVTIPDKAIREEHQNLYMVNDAAASFFQEQLLSQPGELAVKYLEGRGMGKQAIEQFQLGVSPKTGDKLLKHLMAQGFSQSQISEAGLVTGVGNGAPRDLFRGRLIIPIRDDSGNLAGFGGRSIEDIEPKYMNTPRTPIFDKGHILYAFDLAKASMKERGKGIVVEGYMDAITAHLHGFDNVVASMGTAVTEAQVQLLLRTGQQFVLALDPDNAGREATFRSLEGSWRVFEQRKISARRGVNLYQRALDVTLYVAVLPSGKDPDEVIRHKPEEWEQLIQDASSLADYLLATAGERWDLSTSEGKVRATQQLFPLFNVVGNIFDRERFIRGLADRLGTTPATLVASIGKTVGQSVRRKEPYPVPQVSASPFERENRDVREEHLLAWLLQSLESRELVQELSPEVFNQPSNRELFSLLLKCSTIEELFQHADQRVREQVDRFLAVPLPPSDSRQKEQVVRQCALLLEERRLRGLKAEEALRFAQDPKAMDGGDNSEDEEGLAEQIMDTNERLRQLFYTKSQPS